MDFNIHTRTALVFGAGGGLGSAISLALANEGATVIAADVNQEALGGTGERLKAAKASFSTLLWDLGDLDIIERHLKTIEERHGSVDILVNNTGGPPPSAAGAFDAATLEAQFRSMVMSVMAITSGVIPQMQKKGWGRIITSVSSGVVAPIPNLAVSNALRLSLVGWSKTLAREVAQDGITVNTVIPGRIGTARTKFLDAAKAQREGVSAETITQQSVATIPAGRFGRPEEYADAVAFLASDRASYITGTQLRVDGGMLANI